MQASQLETLNYTTHGTVTKRNKRKGAWIRRLNIAENQLIPSSITGAGTLGSGQSLSITLQSIDTSKNLRTGSPNFSIVIH